MPKLRRKHRSFNKTSCYAEMVFYGASCHDNSPLIAQVEIKRLMSVSVNPLCRS